jgi:hypothetical protein
MCLLSSLYVKIRLFGADQEASVWPWNFASSKGSSGDD